MTWLDQIRTRIFRPGDTLESSDRRALLFGAAVTSAGLLVPKSTFTFVNDDTRFVQSCIDRGVPVPIGAYRIGGEVVLNRGAYVVACNFLLRKSGGFLVPPDAGMFSYNEISGAVLPGRRDDFDSVTNS
jgi:hypothetical protein